MVPESDSRPEVGVAKAIASAAAFMGLEPEVAAQGAWEGWRSVLGLVPPPIAIHYQILVFEGRKPRGRPIDLALSFPEYYCEEIAPDLVAWWQEALDAGRIPDAALRETRAALEETREKMRPLLVDRLRLLARLDRELQVATGARRAELSGDMEALERELQRSFTRVSRRPEVLDRRRRPFDRLRLALDDFGMSRSEEDLYLDPDAPPPPPRPVPAPEAPPPIVTSTVGPALVEPTAPPPRAYLPPQPRAGDPEPFTDPFPMRSRAQLVDAYADRLRRTIDPWMGTPYRWGNDTRGVGTDCSGFVREVLEEAFALELPRTSRDQFRCGRSVSREALLPGDLVFFAMRGDGIVSHVGVYWGEGKIAHASLSRGVVLDRFDRPAYQRCFRGARRVVALPE